jgi:hypothetical protein
MALVRIGLGAFRSWIRPIEDSGMLDFNAYLLFYVGTCVRQLSNIKGGAKVSAWATVLVEGRSGLQAFVSDKQHASMFPRSIKHALIVLAGIRSMIPDLTPGTMFQDRMISGPEASDLETNLILLASALGEESEKAYVVVLQKQRAFDLHTLIEAISTAFDSAVWDKLSDFSKREIKESGRCLALERYTASGFHMLRAVENETRDCAILIGRALPTRRDFNDYIKILKDSGADARLVSVLDNVRSLERNPLVHPEDWLSQDDAVNIFCIALAVFSRLISYMESLNLLPPRLGGQNGEQGIHKF